MLTGAGGTVRRAHPNAQTQAAATTMKPSGRERSANKY
jgi:hypothetical protein